VPAAGWLQRTSPGCATLLALGAIAKVLIVQVLVVAGLAAA
jgi:hypothetical protein